MSDTVTNILVAGVGGQGVILASDLMADTFLAAGYDVKKSEVHGMAQRGGAVSSHVHGKAVHGRGYDRRNVGINCLYFYLYPCGILVC